MGGLALLGNLLWLFLGPGIICFIFWAIAGGFLAMTVVGIPFAIAAWRIAGFAAMPFGFLLDETLVPAADGIVHAFGPKGDAAAHFRCWHIRGHSP